MLEGALCEDAHPRHTRRQSCSGRHHTWTSSKGSHSGFGNRPKIRSLGDPVPLTLDLLNPKSISFDRLSRTTTVPSLKSFRSGVFVLSC